MKKEAMYLLNNKYLIRLDDNYDDNNDKNLVQLRHIDRKHKCNLTLLLPKFLQSIGLQNVLLNPQWQLTQELCHRSTWKEHRDISYMF